MKRIISVTAVCVCAIVTLAQPVSAQSTQYELTQFVTRRQAHMFDLQTAYWVLFDVQKGKSTDFAAAADAAAGMSATIDQFVSLLEPGTARGEAPGTRAKPEIWTDPEAFDSLVQNFKESAQSMSEVAATGNLGDFRAEFDAFSAACTSCHGLRPSSGGPFRFAVGE